MTGQCKHFIPVGSKYKRCIHCRGYSETYNRSAKGLAKRKRDIEASRTDHSKKVRKIYRESEIGRQAQKKSWAKWSRTTGGRDTCKKRNQRHNQAVMADPGRKMMARVASAMSTMVSGSDRKYWRVKAASSFDTPQDVRDHFESRFEKGMTFENHGNGNTQWNIGHRIAKAMYNPDIEEDVRRCWNRHNLFPQWRLQNQNENVLLPSASSLMRIRHLWPISWNDTLPVGPTREWLELCARKGKGK